MRPKKKVLLYAARGTNVNALQFVLETRGHYAVTIVHDAENTERQLRQQAFDLLMVEAVRGGATANSLVLLAKEINDDLPALVYSTSCARLPDGSRAECFISRWTCNSEEILIRARMLVMRKRGPKKACVSDASCDLAVTA